MQIANKYMKGAHQEMQIKTRMRYNFTPTTLTTENKTNANKYWQPCGKMGPLIQCWEV